MFKFSSARFMIFMIKRERLSFQEIKREIKFPRD